jgi:hypothetical protein
MRSRSQSNVGHPSQGMLRTLFCITFRNRRSNIGNGGCNRRAAGATVEIALLVHACGQSALGTARPRAATGASMEPVGCSAGPRRSAARLRLPDRSRRLRTRSRRARLGAGHWHPTCPTNSESAMSKLSRRRARPRARAANRATVRVTVTVPAWPTFRVTLTQGR